MGVGTSGDEMRKLMIAAVMAASISGASAQSLGTAEFWPGLPTLPYSRVGSYEVLPTDNLQITRGSLVTNPDGTIDGSRYMTASIPVGTFLGRQEFQSYVAMNQRNVDRYVESSALASAMTILPPNAGDRFAVTVSGSAVESSGAGSVSVSVRLNEQALAFAAYARSQNMNAFKGGVSLSFK